MSSEREAIKDSIISLYADKRRLDARFYDPAKDAQLAKFVEFAVDNCIEFRIDARDYVDAMYRNYENVKAYNTHIKAFYANFLNATGAKDLCDNYKNSVVNFIDDENIFQRYLDVQIRYLNEAIGRTDREPEDVLMDDFIDFADWFRILITKKPFPEIIAKYQLRAKHLVTPDLAAFLTSKGFDLNRIYGNNRR